MADLDLAVAAIEATRAPHERAGAATHPGGSVIALNGRNAAEAVLADAGDRMVAGRA
jgi:hypothetical protein